MLLLCIKLLYIASQSQHHNLIIFFIIHMYIFFVSYLGFRIKIKISILFKWHPDIVNPPTASQWWWEERRDEITATTTTCYFFNLVAWHRHENCHFSFVHSFYSQKRTINRQCKRATHRGRREIKTKVYRGKGRQDRHDFNLKWEQRTSTTK